MGRIIGSDSTRHFETPENHENNSGVRKLGSVRLEAEIFVAYKPISAADFKKIKEGSKIKIL